MRAIEDLCDRSLVEQLLSRRDEQAFHAIVHRHGGMVYRVCLRILQRRQDAEDAFQATFLVLSQNLGSIRNRSSLGSWLYGVARRTSFHLLDQATSRRRHERQAAKSDAVSPVEDAATLEVQAQIDHEVDRLPETLRQPLILCCLEGQSLERAAGQLGWTTSTLRRRLEKARKLLSLRLTRRGVMAGSALTAYLISGAEAVASPSASIVALSVQTALSPSSSPLLLTGINCQPFSAFSASALPSLGWAKFQSACMLGLCALVFGAAALVVTEQIANASAAPIENASSEPAPKQAPAQTESRSERKFREFHHKTLSPFQAVAISSNGKVVAAGGAGGKAYLIDFKNEKVLQEFKAAKPVTGMAFVGDERTLALGTDQGGVEIWVAGTSGYSLKTRLGDDNLIVYAVAASADGKTLAVGCHSGWVHLYDTSTWKPSGVLFERSNLTCSVAFSNDGSFLVTAGNSFRAWKLETNTPLWTATKNQPLSKLEISSMQSLLWRNLSDGDANDDASCADIAISPAMDLVAGVNGTSRHDGGGKTLYAWDARSGKPRWKARSSGLTTVAFSAQGNRIATGSTDGTLRIWDAQNGKMLDEIKLHAKAIRNIVARPNGTAFISVAEDGFLRIWDPQTDKRPGAIPKQD